MHEAQKNSQNAFAKPSNFGKFERKGSTYCWQFNYRNNPDMVRHGYSKPKGQSEKADKMKLLEDIITRLFVKGGYLRQIEKFIMFRCVSNDNKDNVELFTIYPHNYQLSPILVAAQKTDEVKHIKSLLDSLFANPADVYGVSNPLNIKELFGTAYSAPQPVQEVKIIPFDELMDKYAKRPFKDWDEFTNFTEKHLRIYTAAQRNAFVSKVLEFQPDLTNKVNKWKKGGRE